MRHVLSALVTNQPGVLAHITGMLASRAFNIDSLAVGVTEDLDFSRITFVVNGDDHVLDQVRKQLEKIVTVVKVLDFSNRNYVERDLMLIKVSTNSGITSGTGNGSRACNVASRIWLPTFPFQLPTLPLCSGVSIRFSKSMTKLPHLIFK